MKYSESAVLFMITVRNEVAKVMFLQASVCPQRGEGVSASVHGGIPNPPKSRHPPGADTPLGADTPRSGHTPQSRSPPEQTTTWEQTPLSRHPLEQTPLGADTLPPPRNGHCCGRYASYWNAFLFVFFLI